MKLVWVLKKKSFAIANKMHLTYVKKKWVGFSKQMSLGWVCLLDTFVPGVGLSLGYVCPWGAFVPGVGLSLVYVCLGVGLSLG